MRIFRSLESKKLPMGFDASIHGGEPIVEVQESKNKIIVSYVFPGFYLADSAREVGGEIQNFKQVKVVAAGFLAESGKPLLPSFGRYVQIPSNYDYEIVTEKGVPVQFDGILVMPAQEKLTDKGRKKQAFEYDSEAYAKDFLYPKDIVEVKGPFNIDEYCSLLIHVCPFQYNPARKKLIGYGDVIITIKLTPKKKADSELHRDPSSDKEAFGNLFLNPGRRIEERLKIEAEKIVFPPLRFGPEFLIIYAEEFKKAAAELAKWKNRRGLITETVSINEVGNDVVKIKLFIRSKRKSRFSRLRYVLLFGDTDMITPETIEGGAWGDNVTDYYYSTDNDPSSSTDYVFPWISFGRIPVRNETEGMDVVKQIISYEKNPPTDPGYYQRMTFAAFFQEDNMPGQPGYGTDDRGYLKTMEDIRTCLSPLGYNIERVYVTNNPNPQFYNDGTPIPPDVRAAFVADATASSMLVQATSDGQLFIGHRDHGSENGWAHPLFTKSHLNNVTGEMPSLFYSINCLTGRFDLVAPSESFAEVNLRMKGAAPSLIAATRVSHTWLNNYLIKALFDATFGGVLPTFPGGTASYPVKSSRLGDILNYAKSYLPVASTDAMYIKDHYEIYHVVGDPTLELWKEYPLTVKVQAKLVGFNLDIKLSSCPRGSVITIWIGDRLLKRLEPSSLHFSISLRDILLLPRPPIAPFRPSLYVCFWAPGHRFVDLKVSPVLMSA